ncbi:hypothetical protein FB451DRAFT_1460638 [Mycena latifolia]|nr:hypothetical protein FB451DRAFT_1460638 [Mycena latifolia]
MTTDIVLSSRSRLNELLTGIAGSLKVFEDVSIVGPAVKIVTAIVRLVLDMEKVKFACGRLAWRASTLLLDLARRMDGRWSGAPKELAQNIRNYQKILTGIRDMILEVSRRSWASRLLSNSTFKREMKHYNALLDHEFQRFQIGETVEIHYTLGMLRAQQSTTSLTDVRIFRRFWEPPYILLTATRTITKVCRSWTPHQAPQPAVAFLHSHPQDLPRLPTLRLIHHLLHLQELIPRQSRPRALPRRTRHRLHLQDFIPRQYRPQALTAQLPAVLSAVLATCFPYGT